MEDVACEMGFDRMDFFSRSVLKMQVDKDKDLDPSSTAF